MHAHYRDAECDRWPWDLVSDDAYYDSCEGCTRIVDVPDSKTKTDILKSVKFMKGSGQYGPTVTQNLPTYHLLRGDTSVASEWTRNPQDVHMVKTPTKMEFWRTPKDEEGARKGPAVHANPIFSRVLGTSPNKNIAIDIMHTLCYGIIMRVTSAILWRVIFANPWQLTGNKPARIEGAVARLRNAMFEWQINEG
eukprot:9501985-Pyramimonas_sp.AAC.1